MDFRWVGPSGDELLTHILPGHYSTPQSEFIHNKAKIQKQKDQNFTNGVIGQRQILEALRDSEIGPRLD